MGTRNTLFKYYYKLVPVPPLLIFSGLSAAFGGNFCSSLFLRFILGPSNFYSAQSYLTETK